MIFVDIVSDTICPWCYIGKRRFERALAMSGRNNVAISWRPFQLNPDMPPEGMTRDDYVRAKFGGGDRPRQIYQAIAESGREAGIEFQFSRIKRTPNTVLSHRLVHWSARNERQDEMVAELFRAYFEDGLDIGDLDILVECAARVGLDARRTYRYLYSDEGGQEVVASDVYARRLGINGVPCFIVNRKYAVSGAQPPSAFVEIFNLAERDAATSSAQSTVG
jgi:predicted DsbA family dithiol-disulfide isomerase